MSGMHIIWVGIVVAAIAIVGWFLTPRGKNQVYVPLPSLLHLSIFPSYHDLLTSSPSRHCVTALAFLDRYMTGNILTLIPRLIRTCITLTLTCTWLMWAITYLAQLHPLMGMSLLSIWSLWENLSFYLNVLGG